MVQEPGFEPGMTRLFKGRRYACSLLLHGAGGRIRTGRHGGLSTVAIPIRYASKSLVGRGRLELPCSGRLVLSEVCLPNSTTGPCPGRASNPQNCGSQPQASADCATWTSWCGRQDSNLRSHGGNRVTAGQFCHSLTRACTHKLSKNLAESRGVEPRCAEATES